jgi:branched-chain amino acid transport system permease protein
VFIDRVLLDFGPIRFVLIGGLMLLTVLFLRDGLFGMKTQFRAWRDKKKSEARSSRAEKGGEMLPEEATETADKDSIYFRRFDKTQRDFLKTLISDELMREYEQKPLGQHSEALERVLNYFRRQPQNDKHAVIAVKPFEAYRIVALSGQRGGAPATRRGPCLSDGRGRLSRGLPPPRPGPARVLSRHRRLPHAPGNRRWPKPSCSGTPTRSR